jgi:alpha-galactosidase
MIQRLAAWFGMTLLMAAHCCAADLQGDWIFTPRAEFPQFTTLSIEGQSGSIRSLWYGDLPLLNLHQDGERLIFQLDNGNPRIGKQELTLTPSGEGLTLTGKFWYAQLDVTAHRADRKQVESRAFPTYTLPRLRDLPANGLARTPPMGWNSWNKFAEHIDDKTVREIADSLVSSGLRDAGYVYVNIDDGWQGIRDAHGALQPNSEFPDMKQLADYLHARGLKLGLYSSPGPRSCAGFTGTYGHVEQDAKTWAQWGIDYLKYDLCSGEAFYHTYETVRAVYQQMGTALQATGRPFVYSLCEYGRFNVGTWGRKVGGNLWRTTGDISDNYASMAQIGFDKTAPPENAGPGGWNDPDMLEVGNGGMSSDEYRTHLSLWSLLSAPLLLGNDIRSIAPETLAIVANAEVIAIDQDSLGRQARPVVRQADKEIWVKPLADGSLAVGLFNRSTASVQWSVPWSHLGLTAPPASVRDLWKHADLQPASDAIAAEIPAHGVALFRVGQAKH